MTDNVIPLPGAKAPPRPAAAPVPPPSSAPCTWLARILGRARCRWVPEARVRLVTGGGANTSEKCAGATMESIMADKPV